MGQKVNPHGMRVGIIKDWDSRWYADKNGFADNLVEDHKIRVYLKKRLYAAGISKAMKAAIDETDRRRKIQSDYNEAHGITPESVKKSVRSVIEATKVAEKEMEFYKGKAPSELTRKELQDYVRKLEKEMKQAAKDLQFERAAQLRDQIFEYRVRLN